MDTTFIQTQLADMADGVRLWAEQMLSADEHEAEQARQFHEWESFVLVAVNEKLKTLGTPDTEEQVRPAHRPNCF